MSKKAAGIKVCANCKHHHVDHIDALEIEKGWIRRRKVVLRQAYELHSCYAPRVDLVTGQHSYYGESCWDMRERAGPCGIDGKLYEYNHSLTEEIDDV